MNYGLPYRGSKNTIAEKITDALPPGGEPQLRPAREEDN